MKEDDEMLDDELVREIQAFLGKGSPREERAKVNETLRVVAADLGKITRYDEDPITERLKKYGRAPVAVCIASTLYERRERLGDWGLHWSLEVLRQWTWRQSDFIQNGVVAGNAHPTTICGWAREFMELTWA